MSTGAIIAVISSVPWGQVIKNAPKLADSASKLWSTVTGFRTTSARVHETKNSTGKPLPTETEILCLQLQTIEEAVKNLLDQMQASSELIKALADQNAQLIETIELNRVRLVRLGVAAAIGGVVLFAAVIFLVFSQ